MYVTATDAELIRMGHRCESPNVRLYADRIMVRLHTALDARKALLNLADTLSREYPDEAMRQHAIASARSIAETLDWQHDIPHYPEMSEQLRAEYQAAQRKTVKL